MNRAEGKLIYEDFFCNLLVKTSFETVIKVMGGICCGNKAVVVPARKSTPIPTPPIRSPTPRVITPRSIFKAPSTRTPSVFSDYPPEPSFTHIGINARNPLKLIEGYENEPLVSLEEALAPFHGTIDGLDEYVREAKMKCHNPSKQDLTHDESAAIYIYTMKWGDNCLSNELQATWSTEDSAQMKPWLKYLKLFKAAYDKLPNATGEVWQGTSFNHLLNDQLTKKPLTMYSAMGSCSSSKQTVEQYLEGHGDAEKILVGYLAIGGKLLGPYGALDSSDVLVWPGTKVGFADMEVITGTSSIVFHLTGKISKCDCDSTFHS